MMRGRSISGMRRLPLVAAIMVGLYAPTVMAQDTTPQAADAQEQQQDEQDQDQAPAEAEVTELKTIRVTGSLLRRTKQCFTQAEWDKIAEVQRRGVQKTIDGLTEKGGQ